MAVREVDITEFSSNMSSWLDEVKAGDEILLTERDVPVARVTGVGGLTAWEQMIREGLIVPATKKPRTKAADIEKIPTSESVSDILSEHRDHPMYSPRI